MLILALPHTAHAAAQGFAYVQSDGHNVLRHAVGMASTLSANSDEVVAVVPHSRLSWLRVQLPPGSHGPRLSAVLHGLLEDRLLDDVAQLHLTVPAQAQSVGRTGGEIQVAVCDKAWLHEALAPLQAAGLTVQRIVPECAPSDTPVLQVMGEPAHAQYVLSHAQGVTLLPSAPTQWRAFDALRQDDWQLFAEPAMVTAAQHALQSPPQLQSAAQRWLAATQTKWDMAQGEWAQGRAQRLQRATLATWQSLRHGPQWRALRWGILTLLLAHVVGLNLLAWREKQALDAQQAALQNILKTTFPSVSVVIDAPLQMQREVDALQQKSGALTRADLEPLLDGLARVLPAGQLPTQLHFANHALRIQGLNFDNSAAVQAQLSAQGLSLSQEGNDTWVLQVEEAK